MNPKKGNIPTNTVTRNLYEIDAPTGNIYESIELISRRANQVSSKIRKELKAKLEEFANVSDNLEETFENREQIEISSYYEKLPKAVLIATQEFLNNELVVVEGDEAAFDEAPEEENER
ncbi:MAG: DNA-directed RNA polymerase subunit omega [Rikenellaceae bacterium]